MRMCIFPLLKFKNSSFCSSCQEREEGIKKKVCNNFSIGPRSRIANAKRIFSRVRRRIGVAELRETGERPWALSRALSPAAALVTAGLFSDHYRSWQSCPTMCQLPSVGSLGVIFSPIFLKRQIEFKDIKVTCARSGYW